MKKFIGLIPWIVCAFVVIGVAIFNANKKSEVIKLDKQQWECTSKSQNLVRINNITHQNNTCMQYTRRTK